jgi:hypothetical protein
MPLFRRDRRSKFSLPALGTPDVDKVKAFGLPVFWGAKDPEAVARHLTAASQIVEPGFHFADNLFTWARNNSMLDDAAFMEAWRSNAESSADRAIIWRRYILACAAYHCVQLPGDFVECGAYTGVGVKTVVDYLGATAFPKTFWTYDLFVHEDGMLHHSMPEHGEGLEGRVRAKFADYPQVKVFKGAIPDVFAGQSPSEIAYLHIDLNEAPAEIAALAALFDRVVPGGIVILDDYEWAGPYRSQKLAEDAWFQARAYRVIPLPTGQGIVIKR